MQINDGTEPQQDEHDCTDYAKVTCKSGEYEQRFKHQGKLGDNDLENFSVEELGIIEESIDDIFQIYFKMISLNVDRLGILQRLRVMYILEEFIQETFPEAWNKYAKEFKK